MIIPWKDDNPTRQLPGVMVSILVSNVGIFLYTYFLGETGFRVFTDKYGLIPLEVTQLTDAISPTPIPFLLTFFTAMFMHGGWAHLGGNMLYLWIFGNNVEDTLGHVRFLGFYLLCGLVATLSHVVSAPDSTLPLVGSSGAIAGVLGAYMAAFPGARVHVLVFCLVLRIPALLVLGIWFLIQLSNASMDPEVEGGVAWYAHIAGFVVGYLIMRRRRERIREVDVPDPWYET